MTNIITGGQDRHLPTGGYEPNWRRIRTSVLALSTALALPAAVIIPIAQPAWADTTITSNGGPTTITTAQDQFSIASGVTLSGTNATVLFNQTTIGTLTNSGLISAIQSTINSTRATDFQNSGNIGLFVNSGTLNSQFTGLFLESGSIGTLTNNGTISATYFGVVNYGTIGTLTTPIR